MADDGQGRLKLEMVHEFLRTTYCSPGVPRDVVARALAGSLVVGLFSPDGSQVGMARAMTDRATFAWVADVFVLPEHRDRGLGRFVVEALLDHPDLSGLLHHARHCGCARPLSVLRLHRCCRPRVLSGARRPGH